MVSNQRVTRRQTPVLGLVGGLLALTVLPGCELLGLGGKKSAEPAAEVVRPAAAPEAPTGPQNAIEAALAHAPAPGTVIAAPAPATAGPAMNPTAPLRYTVKAGDTLWGISSMYLRDPWLWPEIWHVNPAVANPHLIYPGDVLLLGYGANGEPQVSLVRGDAVRVQPLVRSTALETPIATIPYDSIKAFLGRPTLLSKEDLRDAPRVVALRDRHLVAGAGHDVYVKGLHDKGPGRYAIVRVGEELKDPETGKALGYMGTFAASARVDTTDKLSRAALIESTRETIAGDLLFAEDLQTASTDIVPRAAPADVVGQIMAVVDGVSLIGQYQVVALNRGRKAGLETGHVLAIDQAGEEVADASCKRSMLSWCVGKKVQLPDERAGTLLVFKTYEQMSYGLVVNATVPIRIADRVRAP